MAYSERPSHRCPSRFFLVTATTTGLSRSHHRPVPPSDPPLPSWSTPAASRFGLAHLEVDVETDSGYGMVVRVDTCDKGSSGLDRGRSQAGRPARQPRPLSLDAGCPGSRPGEAARSGS